jgi:cytochrome b561
MIGFMESLDQAAEPPTVRLSDTKNRYGWISITLHWVTAATVLAMWAIGSLSQQGNGHSDPALLHLHTSIGMTAYIVLWARILWRFYAGHPGPLPRQATRLFPLAKYFHFALLLAIGIMLVSGPLMVWSGGESIEVFSLAIASPLPTSTALHNALRALHSETATFVVLGAILHVAAVFKHLVFDRDGTFDKIMIAGHAQPE